MTMTNKDALQSQTEYSNDNLLEKLLLDRGVATAGTYVAANAKDIDLCAADLYFTLAAHPDLREGALAIKYNGAQLIAMAKRILKKYNMDEATVTGEAIW
ncbi:hypothetical protein ES695_06395 [Candidatus Atribacteria bacterium 1244-E10-H5-B2]|nr:MAG: hypothetical protein ES695_06395 [Candidatus Atribacteria bacterium 1244-E10-H5-B2]